MAARQGREALGRAAAAPAAGEEVEESAASIADLIGGEADYAPRPDYPDRLRSRSIDPAARAASVAWILKVYRCAMHMLPSLSPHLRLCSCLL